MKKIKKDGVFMWLVVIVLMMFYPIVSFAEYFHTKDETADKKRFIYYGLLGMVGIVGFAIAFFAPTILLRITIFAIESAGVTITLFTLTFLLIKIAVAIIASAFYISGQNKLRNILTEKMFLGDRLFI